MITFARRLQFAEEVALKPAEVRRALHVDAERKRFCLAVFHRAASGTP
jgi:hypothetical protein